MLVRGDHYHRVCRCGHRWVERRARTSALQARAREGEGFPRTAEGKAAAQKKIDELVREQLLAEDQPLLNPLVDRDAILGTAVERDRRERPSMESMLAVRRTRVSIGAPCVGGRPGGRR